MKPSKLFLTLSLSLFPFLGFSQNQSEIKRDMIFRHTDFEDFICKRELNKNNDIIFYYDLNKDSIPDLEVCYEKNPLYNPANSVYIIKDKIGFYNFDESEDGSLETKMVFNEKGEIIKRIPEEKAEPKREKGKYFANSSNFHA